MSNRYPIDLQTTNQWAIADITSLGFIAVGHSAYDLYNRATGRAHTLHVVVGGFGFGLPAHGSFAMNFDVDYNYFTTARPVNFDDFHLRGADIIGANAVVYSASHLNVYDGPNTITTPKLFSENFTSWGLGFPSVDLMSGVTMLEYGAFGLPRGDPFLKPPELKLPMSPEDLDMNIQMTAKDDAIVIKFPSDILFPTDKHEIRNITPHGRRILDQVASVIRQSPNLNSVEVEGHTDSTGPKNVHANMAYNQNLSLKRSQSITGYLKRHSLMWPGVRFRKAAGMSFMKPVATNETPAGRQLNRRAEIYLWYR